MTSITERLRAKDPTILTFLPFQNHRACFDEDFAGFESAFLVNTEVDEVYLWSQPMLPFRAGWGLFRAKVSHLLALAAQVNRLKAFVVANAAIPLDSLLAILRSNRRLTALYLGPHCQITDATVAELQNGINEHPTLNCLVFDIFPDEHRNLSTAASSYSFHASFARIGFDCTEEPQPSYQ